MVLTMIQLVPNELSHLAAFSVVPFVTLPVPFFKSTVKLSSPRLYATIPLTLLTNSAPCALSAAVVASTTCCTLVISDMAEILFVGTAVHNAA